MIMSSSGSMTREDYRCSAIHIVVPTDPQYTLYWHAWAMTTTSVELDHSGPPLKASDALHPRLHVSSLLKESEVGGSLISWEKQLGTCNLVSRPAPSLCELIFP